MKLLPSELKCHIVQLSSGSPSSLAALARTHTSYRREAEKALYNTLSIHASRSDSMKCMETLVTNSEKAALVHFLTIDYAQNNISKNRRLTDYLSRSLINMHSLSDFRIRSRPVEVHPTEVQALLVQGLGEILWSVCKKFDLLQTNDSAGDAVKIIFDYMLFTATTFLTYLKSLRVKPIYRYLEYILAG